MIIRSFFHLDRLFDKNFNETTYPNDVNLGMASHETITCPRCQCSFECRVNAILRCQCQDVTLTEEMRYFIQQQYSGCLCVDCLRDIKAAFSLREAPGEGSGAIGEELI